jgi:hypothetical protein
MEAAPLRAAVSVRSSWRITKADGTINNTTEPILQGWKSGSLVRGKAE